MRLLVFLSLLCVVVSGQTITRQGYINGTAVPGGCGTANVTDVTTITIGSCLNTTEAGDTNQTSILFNDCSANGLITVSRYNGSSTCDPTTVVDLRLLKTTLAGTSGRFCHDEGGVFATYTCSPAVYPVNSPISVNVSAYATIINPTITTCAGSPIPFTFQAGVCTPVLTLQYAIMANCVNNTLVTGLFYDTRTCDATWNATTNAISNTIVPIGPYAQTGAISAQGKPQAAPGASCGQVPGFAFLNFTCFTTPIATPTTQAPTTQAPTTKAPTAPSSSSTGVGAASTVVLSIAALMAPLIAASVLA